MREGGRKREREGWKETRGREGWKVERGEEREDRDGKGVSRDVKNVYIKEEVEKMIM